MKLGFRIRCQQLRPGPGGIHQAYSGNRHTKLNVLFGGVLIVQNITDESPGCDNDGNHCQGMFNRLNHITSLYADVVGNDLPTHQAEHVDFTDKR